MSKLYVTLDHFAEFLAKAKRIDVNADFEASVSEICKYAVYVFHGSESLGECRVRMMQRRLVITDQYSREKGDLRTTEVVTAYVMDDTRAFVAFTRSGSSYIVADKHSELFCAINDDLRNKEA